jgi:type VI secretion system protein
MNQGLFESLAGRFYDGTPVEAVPLAERRIVSIKDNLSRIFNTREGLLPHLKGLGLPDISEIYRSMPHGVERLDLPLHAARRGAARGGDRDNGRKKRAPPA